MAKAYVGFVGQELSKKEGDALVAVFDKKEVELSYVNSDTDLDGKFVTKATWQANLWENLKKADSKLSALRMKPKKVTSDITEPGTYSIEVETEDKLLKGKLKFVRERGDDSMPVIKPNSNPKHVKLVNRANLKAYDGAPDDLKHLGNLMKKTASYTYAGKTLNGWRPSFEGHGTHEDSGTKGWKAYIDEPSMKTGTVWRLYFNTDYDIDSQTLVVTMTDCKRDH